MTKLYEVTFENESGCTSTIYVLDKMGCPTSMIDKASEIIDTGWRIVGFREVAKAITCNDKIGGLMPREKYILV